MMEWMVIRIVGEFTSVVDEFMRIVGGLRNIFEGFSALDLLH